jgi:hypothetical protein
VSGAARPANPASPYYAFREEDAERRTVYEKGRCPATIFLLGPSGPARLAQADADPFHPKRDIAAQNAFKKMAFQML